MTTLTRDPEQHLKALRHANEIRVAAAHVKRRIREQPDVPSAYRLAAGVLRELPEGSHAIKLIDLLMAIPYVGKQKARRWLRHCSLSEAKRLGEMTQRQRKSVAFLLEEQS